MTTEKSGTALLEMTILADGQWQPPAPAHVIAEAEICIHVDGRELVTMAATPIQQEALALGFLANQGLIEDLSAVQEMRLSADGRCVDLWLAHAIPAPQRKVLTSGCGGGVTFDHLAQRLEPLPADELRVTAVELLTGMMALYEATQIRRLTGGVHGSGLWREGHLLAMAEDVGRHNTLDKLRGLCLQQGIDSAGSFLFSTGRISSEMMSKAARLGCPIVVSRTSATSLAVELARAWNITLIGYIRGNPQQARGQKMRLYSHPERMEPEASAWR